MFTFSFTNFIFFFFPNSILFFQTIDIDNDQDFEVIEENKPSESITRNVLIIHKVKEENFGDYNCSVWNEYGQDYMIIRLEKHSKDRQLFLVFPHSSSYRIFQSKSRHNKRTNVFIYGFGLSMLPIISNFSTKTWWNGKVKWSRLMKMKDDLEAKRSIFLFQGKAKVTV